MGKASRSSRRTSLPARRRGRPPAGATRAPNGKGRVAAPCTGSARIAPEKASRLLDLLEHLENALRRADEQALVGLAQAATLEGVAAGSGSFGHGGLLVLVRVRGSRPRGYGAGKCDSLAVTASRMKDLRRRTAIAGAAPSSPFAAGCARQRCPARSSPKIPAVSFVSARQYCGHARHRAARAPPRRATASAGRAGMRGRARPCRRRPHAMIASACSGSVMRPTAIVTIAGRAPNLPRERHVDARARRRNPLRRRDAAARHVDPVAAARLQPPRELDRFLRHPAAVDPVGRRDAHAQRPAGRPAARTASNTSSGKRSRFSRSAAVGIGRGGSAIGDRNSCSR